MPFVVGNPELDPGERVIKGRNVLAGSLRIVMEGGNAGGSGRLLSRRALLPDSRQTGRCCRQARLD